MVYVGSSSNPFGRFADHCFRLRKGKGVNTVLQESWNNSSGITDWSFRVIGHGEGEDRGDIENDYIKNIPEQLRLNVATAGQIKDKRADEVMALIEQGARYREINKLTGVPISTISSIKRRRVGIDLA